MDTKTAPTSLNNPELMFKLRMKWMAVFNHTIKQQLKFTKIKTVKKNTRMSSTPTVLAFGTRTRLRWLLLSHALNKTSTATAVCFK